jgi:ABC-2 type transport system permease protein
MSRSVGRFWSNVAAVAYKEATAVRHDKPLLAMVFAQPIMMLLLFGYALSNQPANVPWVVLDQNPTAVSRKLVHDIQATGYFLPPQRVASYAEGQRRLQEGRALAFVIVPASFRRDLERARPRIQLLLDGSDPLSAARIASYIGRAAATFEARPRPRTTGPAQPAVIQTRQRFRFNATLRDRNFFLAGLAGMLLTNLCFSATSGGLVAEREAGMYEQMLALPTTPLQVVLGKLVPYVGLAYIVLLFATIAPGVLFGLWPEGSWLTLLLVSLPFVLASLAVGVFVSVLANTSAQSVFITVFFIMPSFVLSGSMLPYQLMPHGVRELGGLFPLRWYQIILRRIIERGAGLAEVAFPALMLLLLFGVLLTLIRWRMKPRLA